MRLSAQALCTFSIAPYACKYAYYTKQMHTTPIFLFVCVHVVYFIVFTLSRIFNSTGNITFFFAVS